jgi:hypothetical protein
MSRGSRLVQAGVSQGQCKQDVELVVGCPSKSCTVVPFRLEWSTRRLHWLCLCWFGCFL